MKTVGIICEYNPFHRGHLHQIHCIRDYYGTDCRIVCLMSGNYVQRGHPAIFDKSVRAEAAVRCGADLVVELPIGICLSSAEGYAAGGVRIAGEICDILSFGTESMTEEALFRTADAIDSPEFIPLLKQALNEGISFPAARQKALERIGIPSPELPNDILGTEYCRAIRLNQSRLRVLPIPRQGSYHSEHMNPDFPSATAIRSALETGTAWKEGVPEHIAPLYECAAFHSWKRGEKAILFRLRTMEDADFEALPYGSEGLWRRLMHASRNHAGLEEIIEATKTKRYTRTRIDRMILCAFLGITEDILRDPAPYLRILAFNDIGRTILRDCSGKVPLHNVGELIPGPYQTLENRCADLYGLFAEAPELPGAERRTRVYYDRHDC